MKIQLQLMRNTLYPLNNGFHQITPCIVAKTPHQLYIFNSPQQQRRYLLCHYSKISRPINIFYTNSSITAFSGLHTLLLEIYERGRANTTNLFLPPRIHNYFMKSWCKLGHRFLQYSSATISVDSLQQTQQQVLQNSKYGFSCKQRFNQYLKNPKYWNYRGNLPNEKYKDFANYDKKQIRDAKTNIINNESQTQHYKDSQMSIQYFKLASKQAKKSFYNYICIPNPTKPRLNKQKIKQLQLSHQQIMELMKNEQIEIRQNDQSHTIKYDQLLIDKGDKFSFAIFSYRSVQDITNLIAHPTVVKYISQDQQYKISCIVHVIEGDGTIVNSNQFKTLIRQAGPGVKHILENSNLQQNYDETVNFPPHFLLSKAVNQKVGEYMPNLCQLYSNYLVKNPKLYMKNMGGDDIILSKNFYEYILSPLRYRGYVPISDNRMLKFNNKPDFKQTLQISQGQHKSQKIIRKQQLGQFDPKVIFLGTSSMVPTVYRNVSAIMLQISKTDSILMDCGDGTFQQIVNHFGQIVLAEVIKSIRIIFITHLHADHCTGILELIQQRNQLYKQQKSVNDLQSLQNNKVFLIIPSNMAEWVHSYEQSIKKLTQGCNILFIETIEGKKIEEQRNDDAKTIRKRQMQRNVFKSKCNLASPQSTDLQFEQYIPSSNYRQILETYLNMQAKSMGQFRQYLSYLKLKSLKPIPVNHCQQSYGVVIQHQNSVKVSYSGDCRPTMIFENQAKNSTLLIHQATYLDNQLALARKNRHSTVAEAISAGINSNSKMTALTHFSIRRSSDKFGDTITPQRYKNQQKKFVYAQKNTFQCFDHLQFNLSEMEELPKITRKIRQIKFANQKQAQNQGDIDFL